MQRRVVITGIGLVTPIGIGKDEFWNNLVNGVSGVVSLEEWKKKVNEFNETVQNKRLKKPGFDWYSPERFTSNVCAPVPLKFNPLEYGIAEKSLKIIDIITQYSLASAKMALDDAKLPQEEIAGKKIPVIFGTGQGGFCTLVENHAKYLAKEKINPFSVSMLMPNSSAAYIAIYNKLKGRNETITNACSAATHAIASAYDEIRFGRSDIAVTGGAEAALSGDGYSFEGFDIAKTLAHVGLEKESASKASRPFDKNRNGFVIGEGAAVLILEEYEHAVSRNAPVYAEIINVYRNCDANSIMAPDLESVADLLRESVVMDGKDVGGLIGMINCHGTSTQLNDRTETEAIKKVFGERAYEILITANKSMTGHIIGAAGAIETIATALSLKQGVVPPTINYETPDEGLDLNYTPNKAIAKPIEFALKVSYGFGGHNAGLLLRRAD